MKIVCSFFVLLCLLGGCSATKENIQQDQVQEQQIPEPEEKIVKLEVTGMTCPQLCVAEVRTLLENCSGVYEVRIDYDNKKAVVMGDAMIDESELVYALEQTRKYGAKVVQ